MNGVKEVCHFLLNMDLFGKNPDLYFKGKTKKPSKLGLVFTIFYVILYIVFLIYKLVRMVKRVDVTFYDSYAYKDYPKIKLTNEEFYGAFSVGGILDETLYYAGAEFITKFKVNGQWNNITAPLEVEPCQLERFGSKYISLFSDQPLHNLYCVKKIDFTLEGFDTLERYSYLNIKLYPCVNFTRDGASCQNISIIKQFLTKNTIEFKIEDNLIIPEIYETPVEPQRKDINAAVFLSMYQKIYAYLQIVFLETDDDITGLNFYSKNKIEKYTKFEGSKVIAIPGDERILTIPGQAVCDITLQLDQKVLTTKRQYTTLLEVLGDVGGLMEIMWIFLNLMTSFITEMLYERSVINNLFTFDIIKNLILLKNKECITRGATFRVSNLEESFRKSKRDDTFKKSKRDDTVRKSKKDDTFKKSKRDDTLRKIDSISDLHRNNIDVYSKEALYPTIQTTKKKIKLKNKKKASKSDKADIKLKAKSNSSKKRMKVVEIGKNDIDEEQNLEQNNYLNGNNTKKSELSKINDKITERNTEKGVKNIKVEKIKRYCLCCTNKKTKVQKYLFEEGKKVLAEKLDIINIFNKLLTVERMQTNFNIEGKYIEMSEECKQNIDNLRKEISNMISNY